jgi:hypothetical protein
VLASNRHGAVVHALDVFFYRWVAGYLVRPWHPLLVLLILALVASAVRMVWRDLHRPRSSPNAAKTSWAQRAGQQVVLGGNALLDTTGTVLPGRTEAENSEGLRLLHRVERFAFGALAAASSVPATKGCSGSMSPSRPRESHAR